MAAHSDGSPKPMKGRTKYGTTSRKHRSSQARSSISGGSWDQNSLPLSTRQASYSNNFGTPTSTTLQHNQKQKLARPHNRGGDPRVILAFNQNSEQGRPFDAFVDVPSPFAKQKRNPAAKRHYHPDPDHHDVDFDFTDNLKSTSQPFDASTSPPPSPHHHLVDEFNFMTDTNMNSNHPSQRASGYIDPRTRALNLQHTRPEWMTWDFVDLFLSNLPPGIRTVDIWNNFKQEGQVDFIDIFVTRSGQKDTKARLRFRYIISDINVLCLTTFQSTTKEGFLHTSKPIHSHFGGWPTIADSCSA
jgi:hypothetical protein